MMRKQSIEARNQFAMLTIVDLVPIVVLVFIQYSYVATSKPTRRGQKNANIYLILGNLRNTKLLI